LIKTAGSSSHSKEVTGLFEIGKQQINEIKREPGFHFNLHNEEQLVNLFFNGIRGLSLAGIGILHNILSYVS
jgi:hypothetical protein